jgi:hypothetical protein
MPIIRQEVIEAGLAVVIPQQKGWKPGIPTTVEQIALADAQMHLARIGVRAFKAADLEKTPGPRSQHMVLNVQELPMPKAIQPRDLSVERDPKDFGLAV